MTTTKQQIIGTPLAGLTYIFLSFTSFTDGERTREELNAAVKEAVVYAKAWKFTKEEFDQSLDDALGALKGCETYEQEKALFIDVLNMLKKQEWWDEDWAKTVVDVLTRLMNVDGGVVAGEIFWIEYIKKDWKV